MLKEMQSNNLFTEFLKAYKYDLESEILTENSTEIKNRLEKNPQNYTTFL